MKWQKVIEKVCFQRNVNSNVTEKNLINWTKIEIFILKDFENDTSKLAQIKLTTSLWMIGQVNTTGECISQNTILLHRMCSKTINSRCDYLCSQCASYMVFVWCIMVNAAQEIRKSVVFNMKYSLNSSKLNDFEWLGYMFHELLTSKHFVLFFSQNSSI